MADARAETERTEVDAALESLREQCPEALAAKVGDLLHAWQENVRDGQIQDMLHDLLEGAAEACKGDEEQAFLVFSHLALAIPDAAFFKGLVACMLDGRLGLDSSSQRAALRVMQGAEEERAYVEALRFAGFFECAGEKEEGLELPGFNLGALKEYAYVVNVFVRQEAVEAQSVLTLLQMMTTRDEGLDFTLAVREPVYTLRLRVRGVAESRWQERSCELALSADTWHQVVVSHSPAKMLKKATMSVHVDGAKVYEDAMPYPALGSIPKGFVGGRFCGRIADPMLLAGALNSTQCDVLFRLNPFLSRLDREDAKQEPFNDHAYAPWRRLREGGIDTVSCVASGELAASAVDFFRIRAPSTPTREEQISKADLPEVVFAYSARNSSNGTLNSRHNVQRLQSHSGSGHILFKSLRVAHMEGGLCPRTRMYGGLKTEHGEDTDVHWMAPAASDDSRLDPTGSCAMVKCSAVYLDRYPPRSCTVHDLMLMLIHSLPLSFRKPRQLVLLGSEFTCITEAIQLLFDRLLRSRSAWTSFDNNGGFPLLAWVLSKADRDQLSAQLLAQLQRMLAAHDGSLLAPMPSLEHRSRCAREIFVNAEIWSRARNDVQLEWAKVLVQCVRAQPLFFRLSVGIQRMADLVRSPALPTSLQPQLIDVMMIMLSKASSIEMQAAGTRPLSRANSVSWADMLPAPAAKFTDALMKSPAKLGRLFRRDSVEREEAVEEDSRVAPSAGELHALLMLAAGQPSAALSCAILEQVVVLLDPLVMDAGCEDSVARGALMALEKLGSVDFLLGIAAHERETLLAKSTGPAEAEDSERFYGLLDASTPADTRAAMLLLVGRMLQLTSGPVRGADGQISPRKKEKETQERQRMDKQLGVLLRTVLPPKEPPQGLVQLLGACLKVLLGGACDPSRPSAVELQHEGSQVEMPEVLPVFGELLQALEGAEEKVQADAREMLLKLSIVLKSSAEARTYMTDYPQWQRWLLGLVVVGEAEEAASNAAQVLSEVAVDLLLTLIEHDMERQEAFPGLEELCAAALGLEKERQRLRFEARLRKAKESKAKFLIPEFNALAERKALDAAMRLLRLLMVQLWTRLSLRAQPFNRLDSPQLSASLVHSIQMAEEILLHPMQLFKLSPLSPGGVISSSTSAAFVKNTALEPHGVRCVLDPSPDTKWVDAVLEGSVDEPTPSQATGFVANVWNRLSSTSLSADDSAPWISYRYPSTLVDPEATAAPAAPTRMRHRVVFYIVHSACDLPELDPAGWSLYGRVTEDEPFILLDRRIDVSFPGRYGAVPCWVKQTGFFEEYKLVFDTSAKRKSVRDANTGERMVYKLQLGQVAFFQCDVPNWHLDRQPAVQKDSRNVQLLQDMEAFVLRALSTIEVVKASDLHMVAPVAQRAMLRLVCHVMMFSTQVTVIELCITLLQAYLAEAAEAAEQQEQKALQRQNVLLALHAVAHCLSLPQQTAGNKDLCVAMALAFVNTFSFDDDGTVAAAFMRFREEAPSADYLSQCLALLEPLSRQALQEAMQAEVTEESRRSFLPSRTSAAQREAQANSIRLAAYGAGKIQRPVGLPRNVRYRMSLFRLKERERRNNLVLQRKIWNDSLEWKARQLLVENEAMRYTLSSRPRNSGRQRLWTLDTRYNDKHARIPLTLVRAPEGNAHVGAAFSLSQRIENNRMDWTEIGKELSKQTAVADVSKRKLDETASDATHTDGEDEEDVDVSMRLGDAEVEENDEEEEFHHMGKRMTMEQWVNRSPSHLRGEWPGPWPAVKSGEIVLMAARCYLISPHVEICGRVIVSSVGFYFDPDPPEASMYIREDQYIAPNAHMSDFDSESAQRWRQDLTGPAAKAAEEALKREQIYRSVRRQRQLWRHKDVSRVLLRRYRMRDHAAEIFLHDGTQSFFLDFPEIKPGVRKSTRNRVLEEAWSYLPYKTVERSQKPGKPM